MEPVIEIYLRISRYSSLQATGLYNGNTPLGTDGRKLFKEIIRADILTLNPQ